MELETATLRCSSCGARCDPARSFCRRCGSAVFVDDAVYSRLRQMPDLQHGGSQVGEAGASPGSGKAALPLPRTTRRPVRRGAVSAPPAGAAAGAGCLGSLVRWAVFVGIAYYALNVFGLWPGLRSAAEGLLQGDQAPLTDFIDRLRGTTGTFTSPPSGESPRRAPRTP